MKSKQEDLKLLIINKNVYGKIRQNIKLLQRNTNKC